jgi:outer membrane immunogenic protein
MNTQPHSHKLFRWITPITQALAVGGMISLSAYAQVQTQPQLTQDKGADAATVTETPANATADPVNTAGVPTPAFPKPMILPPPATNKWTGWYGGGHVGYGWGRADTTFTPLPTATAFINLAPTKLRPDPKGIIAGGQFGYNKQISPWVLSAEFTASWSNMKGTAIVTPIIQNNGTPFPGAGFLITHQDTSWFGTLRPRFGILPTASHRLLLYVTGGWAFGHVNYSANSDFRPGGTIQYPVASSKTKTGWTTGGGAEIAVAPHASLNLEYLYYNLGNESVIGNPSPAAPPFQVGYNWQTRAQIFRVGVNFH